jgi:hypothetical protein
MAKIAQQAFYQFHASKKHFDDTKGRTKAHVSSEKPNTPTTQLPLPDYMLNERAWLMSGMG